MPVVETIRAIPAIALQRAILSLPILSGLVKGLCCMPAVSKNSRHPLLGLQSAIQSL